MKRLLLVFFFILSINAFAQDEKDQKYVGSFNAPTIDIKDYDRIDFALKKTLTEEELILSGKGLIVIIFSINGNGRILQIKSINYSKGKFGLNELNEEIFKLNLKKYVKFNVPKFYEKEKSIDVSQIYKKNY